MAEDIQRKIMGIINEIAEKSSDGNYIYRGEHGWHEQVSSSLWRQFHQYRSTLRADFDYDTLQRAYVFDARQYDRCLHQDDFEAASQLQHVGGSTNLIDFTKCHLVALFFACDGDEAHRRKPGRVILLKQTEQIENKYKIKKPCNPINRITAQKSVFVQHPSGIIEEDDIEEIICIRPSFKQPILTYLREKHCIYKQKIYNDRHGYIEHQKNHHDAYSEYGRGVFCYSHAATGNNNTDVHTAIEHFSNAIKLYPDCIEAYLWRAKIYLRVTGDFGKAIEDYTKAIELDPDYASAYFMRGWAYSEMGYDDRAKQDLKRAIELGDGNAKHLLQEVQARLNQ